MTHPFEFIPNSQRKPLFLFFLTATLIMYGIFALLDQPLRTSAASMGIVSFELAYSPTNSQNILNSWNEEKRLFAAFGLGFDYLFMPLYSVALSLGLLLAGAKKIDWAQRLTVWLGWAALIAAGFDAVENYALWQILQENMNTLYPLLAAVCAWLKFTLLGVSLAFATGLGLLKKRTSG